jgi:repressor LexA
LAIRHHRQSKNRRDFQFFIPQNSNPVPQAAEREQRGVNSNASFSRTPGYDNRVKNGFTLEHSTYPTGTGEYLQQAENLRLTFAFFSPKVPVEKPSEWRRRMALTKRQKEVLDFLVAFETKHGYAPSFEEIGKGLKLTSLATVHKHITTLEKKGFIRRGYNQSRSIEIVQLPKSVKDQVMERKIQELPLVGRIAAGRPLEAVEERETLSLGDFARGGNSFVLQVKGSSMIEDHIMDGDYVVCEQTQVANAGDIVVALVGGDEATLKRFYREGAGKIRLQPANSEMAPIMVAANDVKIQGRVIGVLRKY